MRTACTTTSSTGSSSRVEHQIFLLDTAQSVRPADLPRSVLDVRWSTEARTANRRFELTSQLRVAGGSDYIGYIRQLLSDQAPEPLAFPDYDFRLFDDLGELHAELAARETEHGLARLVAGYAWKWHSQKDRSRYDIEIDGLRLQWNTTDVDWVNSPTATSEVGSIHTIQGYDLNYAGVIIGRDLRWDEGRKRLWFDRTNHFDAKGTQNNPRLGITYTDEDLLDLHQEHLFRAADARHEGHLRLRRRPAPRETAAVPHPCAHRLTPPRDAAGLSSS